MTGLEWREVAHERGDILTPKQSKALAALLTQPTKEQAARAAGVGLTTLKRYLDDPDFRAAYQQALSELVADATAQAKQSLSPALSCLREIVEDGEQGATARISAARSLLEYGLRLTEMYDIVRELEDAEGDHVL